MLLLFKFASIFLFDFCLDYYDSIARHIEYASNLTLGIINFVLIIEPPKFSSLERYEDQNHRHNIAWLKLKKIDKYWVIQIALYQAKACNCQYIDGKV